MSYSIKVTVASGTPHAVAQGPVPDGTYTVAGHIDTQREDITAERVTAEGKFASRASGTVYKEV